MFDIHFLQPEGVLPIGDTWGIAPQSVAFQGEHSPSPLRWLSGGDLSISGVLVDDHPPPPPAK